MFLMLLAGAALSARVANAGLRYQSKAVDLQAALADSFVKAEFQFTNNGSYSILLKKIMPSCGCTTAEADKKVYLPGEKGIIHARVELGAHQGELLKTLKIETDDKSQPETTLTIHIKIPRLVTFSPQPYVRWDQGGSQEPKTVTVTVLDTLPFHITGLKSYHDKIKATLKEIVPGKKYEVTVWPTDTKDVINNAVELLTDAKFKGPKKKIWLLVHVKPKGES
jgi:hypothetical protein